MAGVAPEVPRALAGRYRLVRLLARGGMAEVWEGRDEVLSRPVAVKVLLSHLANDPYLRERFRREAVTAARLVHPGIVAIFDAGVEVLGEEGTVEGTILSGRWSRDDRLRLEMEWPEQPSTAFIVMELVPGETLKDLMTRRGALAAELAVAVTGQVAEALAYAHAQGLVHRDIKPANVLLGPEGGDQVRVKVADFGIAKAAATAHLDLTASGTLLGTPKYLSPEQVQGEEPDARADLYSLGVVLFEMLSGQAPFRGSTEMATAFAHVQQPVPDLATARPGLPAPLYQLVSDLLAKDPSQRVASALVLQGALGPVRRSLGLPAGDSGSHIRLRPPPVAPGAEGPGTVESYAVDDMTEARLAWGPTQPIEAPRARGPRHRSGRTVPVLVALLVLAGCVTLVALVIAGNRGTTRKPAVKSSSASRPSVTVPAGGTALQVVGVHELTQDDIKPDDFLNLLPDVVTGRSPAWHSAQYDGPRFGGSGGFGLVLQLNGQHALHQLQVVSPMLGWSAEVFVDDQSPGQLDHWGGAVASGQDLSGDHTFALHGRSGSWVLLWMTDPGPDRVAVIEHLVVT